MINTAFTHASMYQTKQFSPAQKELYKTSGETREYPLFGGILGCCHLCWVPKTVHFPLLEKNS